MESQKIRVRFAPSPTGPLHIGGVRTALYNYLFAKKHGGDFILRIEDTDQARSVPGAEAYIIEALKWCGIEPNEGVGFGDGPCAPYRQSERKAMYRQYAEQLVKDGYAYYAFDSSEELNEVRLSSEKAGGAFMYNAITRQNMKNSLTLSADEVAKRISAGETYVIRIKIPDNEDVRLEDMIRSWVVVQTLQMDDKVLFKGDGMPTYHLANVVDDYLMKTTHVIRGEEWLPSAPLHVLLYRYLGWESSMPQFAHLPLLLRPDGNGKLSKRDGDRLGFPVFPLSGETPDAKTGKPEKFSGYREAGYFPDAFINMLALLGWNPGTEQEIFTMDELIKAFSFEHIHKSGARFNPEKAKWFNQQYLHKKNVTELADIFTPMLNEHLKDNSLVAKDKKFIETVCSLVKEKATFVNEFWNLSSYIFIAPSEYDTEVIKRKWNEKSKTFFELLNESINKLALFQKTDIENTIKQTCEQLGIKTGEVMQLIRVLITGKGSGVDLLGMMELIGKEEVCNRLTKGVTVALNISSKQTTK
jgi:glutamyl-tRNA synthetase